MKTITASELDEKFDNGEDISEYLDFSTLTRPNLLPRTLEVDFPTWVVNRLDREAERLGVTRESLINDWIAERLSVLEEQKKAS